MFKKFLLKWKIALPISAIFASSVVLVACSVPSISKPKSNVMNLSDVWNNYFQESLRNFAKENPTQAQEFFGTTNLSPDYFNSVQEFHVYNPKPDKDKKQDDNFQITKDNFVTCFNTGKAFDNGYLSIKQLDNKNATIYFQTNAKSIEKGGFELNIVSLSSSSTKPPEPTPTINTFLNFYLS